MEENNTVEGQKEDIISGFRKHIDKIFASTTLGILVLCLGFYYTTKDTLANHTEQIKTANDNIRIIKQNMEDIKSLRELMIEYKDNQKTFEADMKEFKKQSDFNTNKIYDKLIEMNKR